MSELPLTYEQKNDNTNEDILKVEIESLKEQQETLAANINTLNTRFVNMGKTIVELDEAVAGVEKTMLSIEGKMVKLGEDMFNYMKTPPVVRFIHPSQSPTIGEISKALATARGEIGGGIEKDGKTGRGEFSTYAAMVTVCDPILAKNELAIAPRIVEDEEKRLIFVVTLSHSSNEFFETRMPLNEMKSEGQQIYHQKIGAAETYHLRYLYINMLGLACKD